MLEEDDEIENIAVNALVEFINGLAQRRQRTCIPDYVENIIPIYSDKEFIMHYRLKRMLVMDIIDKFNQWPHFRNLGGHGGFEPISAEKHIFTFLWFAGHQSASFRDVADRFSVSLSTVESILRRVTQFLYEMRNEVIRYPIEAEKQRTQRHYFENKDFPGVIGSIDGSYIRIDKPSEDPVAYINRKHYFSVHMQGTVNEKKKFLDVFVGYPGSVHDARVFANSSLAEDLPALCQDGSIFLDDAAYPCLPQLITPYRDNGHLTQAQRNFNRMHSQCRISVEHGFGELKQRFRQLYFLKLRNMEFIVKFILVCCVLHNLANLDDLEYMEEPEEPENEYIDINARALQHLVADEDEDPIDDRRGRDLRDELCRQLFQRQLNE
ncbi:putative nuclease HARBI1 [Mycetomoellerius zeteki]|uniref:putative nuclease HARBI1 n=1 Tax=Mycetomoellerius zeteki TaxID=64791 RepID=UPI00084E6F28|nr:PREDICTED: putative nuclease HARBI1 [Trachymyrmex zeteki]